jgi:hypothetical protein
VAKRSRLYEEEFNNVFFAHSLREKRERSSRDRQKRCNGPKRKCLTPRSKRPSCASTVQLPRSSKYFASKTCSLETERSEIGSDSSDSLPDLIEVTRSWNVLGNAVKEEVSDKRSWVNRQDEQLSLLPTEEFKQVRMTGDGYETCDRLEKCNPSQSSTNSSAVAKQWQQPSKLLVLEPSKQENEPWEGSSDAESLPDLTGDLCSWNLPAKAVKTEVAVEPLSGISKSVGTTKQFGTVNCRRNGLNGLCIKSEPGWCELDFKDNVKTKANIFPSASEGCDASGNKTLRRNILKFTRTRRPLPLQEFRSRRYISLPHNLSSHSALKHYYNSQNVRDNTEAKPVGCLNGDYMFRAVQSHVNLLTDMIQQLSINTEVPASITQSWLQKLATSKSRDAVALYSAIKLRALYNPPPKLDIDVDCVLKVMCDQIRPVDCFNKILVTDYIVSVVELQLLHYPHGRTYRKLLNSTLSVDSSFLKWLLLMTRSSSQCESDFLHFLQRTAVAISTAAARSSSQSDGVTASLLCVYEAMDNSPARSRVLLTTSLPLQRFNLSRQLLIGRCTDRGHFVQAVHNLPDIAPVYLGERCSSCIVQQAIACGNGTMSDRIEDFVALIVTAIESFINMRRGQYIA